MKLRKGYIIISIVCILMSAAIVAVNYIDYRNGKIIQREETDVTAHYSEIITREPLKETETKQTININTASAQELAGFLPGIGESKAENIVAYRKAIGGYKSVDELIEVSGIGESTLELIRDYCRVSDD